MFVCRARSLASLSLLWTVFLCGQIRKFVISATIAQWCARAHACPHPIATCCVSSRSVGLAAPADVMSRSVS